MVGVGREPHWREKKKKMLVSIVEGGGQRGGEEVRKIDRERDTGRKRELKERKWIDLDRSIERTRSSAGGQIDRWSRKKNGCLFLSQRH